MMMDVITNMTPARLAILRKALAFYHADKDSGDGGWRLISAYLVVGEEADILGLVAAEFMDNNLPDLFRITQAGIDYLHSQLDFIHRAILDEALGLWLQDRNRTKADMSEWGWELIAKLNANTRHIEDLIGLGLIETNRDEDCCRITAQGRTVLAQMNQSREEDWKKVATFINKHFVNLGLETYKQPASTYDYLIAVLDHYVVAQTEMTALEAMLDEYNEMNDINYADDAPDSRVQLYLQRERDKAQQLKADLLAAQGLLDFIHQLAKRAVNGMYGDDNRWYGVMHVISECSATSDDGDIPF
jgi:DNA-binding MarR family transcriptional regulator